MAPSKLPDRSPIPKGAMKPRDMTSNGGTRVRRRQRFLFAVLAPLRHGEKPPLISRQDLSAGIYNNRAGDGWHESRGREVIARANYPGGSLDD